jgi:hypothetical protein
MNLVTVTGSRKNPGPVFRYLIRKKPARKEKGPIRPYPWFAAFGFA